MKNVMEFKSVRNEEAQPSTALVCVSDMSDREAFLNHTKLKERGRGAIKRFIENETVYSGYPQYHYQLKKKGIMPLGKRKSNSQAKTLSTTQQLEQQVEKLQYELLLKQTTPAERAIKILYNNYKEIGYRSRAFLCSIISRDRATLTDKQEKWLSDLEA